MKAILTEKPSVAREIASIVGATERKEGFIEGNGYLITWALGHLVGLAMPEEYGYQSFQKESLPMLPTEFILTPRQVKTTKGYEFDKNASKQLQVIESVFSRCTSIIVATDAGREGELIFRYIYQYLGCQKPFSRLWISSLTDKAIREGLANLKDGEAYNKLYQAAKVRSEADWLVGINATQALSVNASQGVYSLGRVQSPTLSMVCKRYLENKHFVTKPYWTVEMLVNKDGKTFKASVEKRFENKDEASHICQRIEAIGRLKLSKIERKKSVEKPPLLYDLTSLQKEANSQHGFSASKTLNIAQILYEKQLLTYPRTGSSYISEDVFEEIPSLLKSLHSRVALNAYAKQLKELYTRSVDAAKVSDHHAILITGKQAKDLTKYEQILYDMVAQRMLEAFSPNCQKELTKLYFHCEEIEINAKGTCIVEQGWRALRTRGSKEEELLPVLSEDETLPLESITLLEKQTKPKALLTEASLLSAMETAGKELENEAYRKSISEVGIGTPATRASIIETLFARDYILRENKSLVPTPKGLAVYQIIKGMKISNAEITGIWEHELNRIEKGTLDASTFMRGIKQYTMQITEELLNSKLDEQSLNSISCPKCKEGNVLFFPKVAKCNQPECGLLIFRNICSKKLSDKELELLLTQGKTPEIKGFKSKKGSSFSAFVVLDSEFNTSFQFPKRKPPKKRFS